MLNRSHGNPSPNQRKSRQRAEVYRTPLRRGQVRLPLQCPKHGIDAASIVIPGEDPADYDALVADYHRDFRPESPSEAFHVDTMLRADWQKRRLQRVEADLHRTLLAETPGASLASALLSDSPAAKLLARVQRQIAAFERTWYRANTELRRARRQAETDTDNALNRYIDSLGAPSRPELASFPQSANDDSGIGLRPVQPGVARTSPDRHEA